MTDPPGYLTAAMHCLAHVPPLVAYTHGPEFEATLATRRKNACELARRFAALVRDYWKASDDPPGTGVSCSAVHAAFCTLHRKHDRDARAALRLLIESLHAALSTIERLVDRPVPFAPGFDAAAWDAHCLHGGYSLLTEIFESQMVRDGAAKHSWVVAVEPKASIEKCLEGLDFTRLPLCLVVNLAGESEGVFVAYDSTLRLAECNRPVQYKLFGVVLHRDGDWASLCANKGVWYHRDRTKTVPLENINDLLQKDAVMLLYKREWDVETA